MTSITTLALVSFLPLGQAAGPDRALVFGAGANQRVAPAVSFTHGAERNAQLAQHPRETAREIRGGHAA